jgi:hypothetical protein
MSEPMEPTGIKEPQDRPARRRKKMKWILVAFMVLFGVPLTALVFLATTGWVFDPLLGPVLARAAPADAPARPHLEHLRVRLHPGDGLLVEARGLRLDRPDGLEAAHVAGIRMEWTAEQLWRRHWAASLIEVKDVRITLHRGADGAIEWLPPAAEETAPPSPPSPPPTLAEVERMLTRLLPVDGQRTEVRCGPVTVRVPDAFQWPSFSIAESSLQLSRDGRTLSVASDGRALIDAHEGLFTLGMECDFAAAQLRGEWDARRIDLGWTAVAARLAGHAAGLTGMVDASVAWELCLESLLPQGVRLRVATDGMDLAWAGVLAQPLAIEPWELALAFDFGTGYGTLAPFALKAGPLELSARLDTVADPVSGEQQMRFAGLARPFAIADVAGLLEPGLAVELEQWVEQTGGWELRRCELSGWIGIDMLPNAQPAPREAHWVFDFALQGGPETLAIAASADWIAEPFSLDLEWRLPPFRPSSLPLPAELAQWTGLVDLPVSAEGSASYGGEDILRTGRLAGRIGEGRLRADGRLAEWLGRDLAFDGAAFEADFAPGLRRIDITRMEAGWEGIRMQARDCSLSFDDSPLIGKARAWQAQGGFLAEGMTLARLTGPLVEELRSQIPLESADLAAWGLSRLEAAAGVSGSLGADLVPQPERGNFSLEAALVAAGEQVPVVLGGQLEARDAAWLATVQAGTADLDLAALLGCWPTGIAPEVRQQVMALAPAALLREFQLRATAEYADGRAPDEMLKGYTAGARLEKLAARLPGAGGIAVDRVVLSADSGKGVLEVSGIRPEGYSGSFGLRADWAGPLLDLPEEVRLALDAVAGSWARPEWAGKAFPIDELEFSVRLAPSRMAVEEAALRFRGAGMTLELEELRAHPDGDLWAAAAALRLSGVDFSRLLAFWPDGIEEELRQLVNEFSPVGRIDKAAVRLEGRLDPAAPGPEQLSRLEFQLQASDWGAGYADWLRASVPAFSVEGNLGGIRLEMPRMSAGPLQVMDFILRVVEPLAAVPVVDGGWSASVELGQLPRLVETAPAALLDPDLRAQLAGVVTDIGGSLGIKADFASPLAVPFSPERLSANLAIGSERMRLPVLVEGLRIGQPELTATLRLENGTASMRASFDAADCDYPGWINGPLSTRIELADASAAGARLTWSLDADQMVIAPDAIGMVKRKGEAARMAGNLTLGRDEAEWSANTSIIGKFLMPFAVAARARLLPEAGLPFGGMREVFLDSLALGQSDLSGRVAPTADGSALDAVFSGKCLHIDEIVQTLSPILDEFLSRGPEQPTAASGGIAAVASAPAPAGPVAPAATAGPAIRAQLGFDRVELGGGKAFQDFKVNLEHAGAALPDLTVNARDGDLTVLRIGLQQQASGSHALEMAVSDIAGLAMLCVAPLESVQLPRSGIAQNLDVARRVPDSFSGGTLALQASYDPANPEALFSGSLRVDDMMMVKAPCLLRLVAGVSGKSFVEGVVFKLFAVESFKVGKDAFSLEKFAMDGPVTMNIHEGYYRFADQFIKVSGEHYLTNFVLEGPITKPEVWLDNKMTRAIGSDDSDWADW